jgi:cellulose synthase operon protein C
MPLHRFSHVAALAVTCILTLAACESPEERAEGHYNRAVQFLAEGEQDRGVIELRNALQANADHVEARLELARLLRKQGNLREAAGSYHRVVEIDPEAVEAHRALAEIALEIGDHSSAESQIERAFELAPEDPVLRALKATVEFRRDNVELAIEMATAVLEEAPDTVLAHLVLIAERSEAGDFEAALAYAEAALALVPENGDLHVARLNALTGAGDLAAVGLQLQRMMQLFPDDDAVSEALVDWHLAQGEREAALLILRQRAERNPDSTDGFITVAQFLLEVEGPDAARADLARHVETHPEPLPFVRALAQLDFTAGRHDEAISALRAMVDQSEPSAEIRELQVVLAEMLGALGRTDESMALLDTVLDGDSRHLGALKARARINIEADRTERALADLRVASTEAPRDPEVLTLMALAHEREGAIELVGERLARAAEASNFGIAESLRYARFLVEDARLGPAESVLLDALNRNPQDVGLLSALGRVHIARGDWTRSRQISELLRSSGSPGAVQQAIAIEIAAIQAGARADDAVSMISDLAQQADGEIEPRVGLVQAHILAGDIVSAQEAVAGILADDPTSVAGLMMQAGLHVIRDEHSEAESIYRALISDHPDRPEPYNMLFILLRNLGRDEEGGSLLTEGLAATGRDSSLLNAKAAFHYLAGDKEAAITFYEELYAREPSSLVATNNLASLLSSFREDAESLERAFRIARRLRGTNQPEFQDTYGWILVRRGDFEQALTYLEPAAASLPEAPIVHYHLGVAYFGLERWDLALAALTRATDLAGEESDLPQIDEARQKIADLESRLLVAPTDG